MLQKILIERFKSIRSADLDLGKANIFIGGNGAGKSNFLEAIGLVSAGLSRGVSDGDLTRKGLRLTPPELMKSAFKGLDLPKTLKIAVTLGGSIEYRMHLTGRPDDPLLAFSAESCTSGTQRIFGRSYFGGSALGQTIPTKLDKHRGMWDQVRAAFDFPEDVSRALDELSQYVIYSPQTDFLRGAQSGNVDSPPVGLRGEGLPSAVRGLLAQYWALRAPTRIPARRRQLARKKQRPSAAYERKQRALALAFLPGWARSFKVGRLDDYLTSRGILNRSDDMVYFIDKFMHRNRSKLSAYDSSEGTLFLLFAAVLLAHDESPSIFGFDNVDSALNPRITRSLMEAIIGTTRDCSEHSLSFGPKQVFLTSHHPSTLDAFDLFDDQQRVFVVERDADGYSTITRLQPKPDMTKEDWVLVMNGRRLSQLWMDGEIRGALGVEKAD